jgi:Protein of unknown function (DUF2752)
MGLAAATLLLPLLFVHDAHFEHGQSLCPFKALTGFPCPGCGITKSLVFLYKGDLARSVHYHVLGIPLALFCVAVIIVALVELSNGRRYFRSLLYSKRLAWGLGIGLGVYHMFRLVEFVHSHDVDGILRESIWR